MPGLCMGYGDRWWPASKCPKQSPMPRGPEILPSRDTDKCRRLGDLFIFQPCLSFWKGPARWRAHVLVTLSFLWQPGLCMGRCGDGGRRPNVPNKAQCREVRRCGALAVAQTASQRRQSSVTSPQSSSFSAAPASSSASSGGESGRQPEWSPIHGDVSSHGPQLSLWGGVTRECG